MQYLERTILKISSDKYENQFTCKGEIIQFDGFLKVYIEGIDNNENEDSQGLLTKSSKRDSIIWYTQLQQLKSLADRHTDTLKLLWLRSWKN